MSSVPWTFDSGVVTFDSGVYTFDGGDSPIVTYRVQAVAAGFYGGTYRNVGDVFDVPATFLSSSSVSFVPPGNAEYPLYGWMQTVPNTTPLFSWALANGGASSPRNSPRRTVV